MLPWRWQSVYDARKGRYSSSWEPHLRATGRHLPYGITQCYLPTDTSERTPPNASHADWYSVYLPRRDGRLSWPRWLDSAPAGSRTSDLAIMSPTPNRCTTKTTTWRSTNVLLLFLLLLSLLVSAHCSCVTLALTMGILRSRCLCIMDCRSCTRPAMNALNVDRSPAWRDCL